MRTPIIAGILLVGLGRAPTAAQVCLGRSLPGEGTVAVDAAASVEPAARLSIGGYAEGGFGLRLGLVGLGRADPWRPRGVQIEALVAVAVNDTLELCPGVSLVRPLPHNDGLRLAEFFTSIGLRTSAGRSTVITFLTPRVAVRYWGDLGVTHLNDVAFEDPEDYGSELIFGATIGVALLWDPVTFRATMTALGPNRGEAGGALGLGVAIRSGPGAESGR